MSYPAIRKAFRDRLKTLAQYGISYENTPFKPTVDKVYLRESFHPGDPIDRAIPFNNAVTEYRGYYQVSICAPSDKGVSVTDKAIKDITELFDRGTTFDCITIIETPSVAHGLNEGAFYITPVTIYFRSFQ